MHPYILSSSTEGVSTQDESENDYFGEAAPLTILRKYNSYLYTLLRLMRDSGHQGRSVQIVHISGFGFRYACVYVSFLCRGRGAPGL